MTCRASHPKMSILQQSNRAMCRLLHAIVIMSSLLGFASIQLQAQTLPATAPTALPTKNALPAPIAASPQAVSSAAKVQPHRATVTYAAGMLDVRADDSSLNQILREIGRLTGMKITGGVADQRVFGNYGPAEPSTILATLLDGTGSNMLLRETADNTPTELVLTPRNGGVTPPNPNAPGFDGTPDEDSGASQADVRNHSTGARAFQNPARAGLRLKTNLNAAPQQNNDDSSADQNTAQPTQNFAPQQLTPVAAPANSSPVSIPQPLNNINGSASTSSPSASTYPVTDSVPTDSLPTPSTTPSTSGIVDAPNTPAPGGTTAGSLTPTGNVEVPATVNAGTATGGTAPDPSQPAGNGPATPEQIFQQLQALRQQQQSGSSTTAAPNATTPAPK